MAQFDVYPNPSKHTKAAYPYILDIQHSLIDELDTRIVVPLGDAKLLKQQSLKGLTPIVTFKGFELILLIPQISTMQAKQLSKPVGTLLHLRDEIIAALDLAIFGV